MVEKALFEGMMDDAINVHSTCLGVMEVVDSHTLKCKYMHRQAVGFEVFLPGEKSVSSTVLRWNPAERPL